MLSKSDLSTNTFSLIYTEAYKAIWENTKDETNIIKNLIIEFFNSDFLIPKKGIIKATASAPIDALEPDKKTALRNKIENIIYPLDLLRSVIARLIRNIITMKIPNGFGLVKVA